jgi:hypothetical protein
MTPAERVHRLVASGSVAPEEGARLLAAMSEAPPRSRLALLVNPFERFGGGTAAALGAVISVASIAVSRFGVRFDGFLDVHVNRAALPSLHVAIVDQLVGWLLPALCFWVYARILTRHVRIIDFVGMVGLARLPSLLSALVLVPLMPADVTVSMKLSPSLLAIALVAVVFGVANVTLLYNGFKNASGLMGVKLVGGFIGLVIAIEALSKVVLLFLS